MLLPVCVHEPRFKCQDAPALNARLQKASIATMIKYGVPDADAATLG